METISCLKYLKQSSSDFGCGIFVFGCFSPVISVFFLFFMFVLGLKLMQVRVYGNRFVQCNRENDLGLVELMDALDDKNMNFKCSNSSKNRENSNSSTEKNLDSAMMMMKGGWISDSDEKPDENEKDVGGLYDEDQLFDVISLRKLVKREKKRGNDLLTELENERMAGSSATEETLAMILRLQREKSIVELEFNQYKRMSEHRHEYNQQMIQALQWILMKHESNRDLLEEKLRVYATKVKTHLKEDEVDLFEGFQSFSTLDSNVEGEIDSSSEI